MYLQIKPEKAVKGSEDFEYLSNRMQLQTHVDELRYKMLRLLWIFVTAVAIRYSGDVASLSMWALEKGMIL